MARSADPRMNRREKLMGAKENKVEVAAQPLPGAPQNQKGGNVANNPFFDNGQGQMFQQMGTEGYQYPYGDGGLPLTDGRKGAVGFVANSGQPQNVVTGQRQNSTLPYGSPQLGAPDNERSGQMELTFNAQQAGMRAAKLYAGQEDQLPSYQISGMGMIGMQAEMNSQQPNPGQIPNMPSQSGVTLSLQGVPDVQMAQNGMSTGRGGGRNQSTQQA